MLGVAIAVFNVPRERLWELLLAGGGAICALAYLDFPALNVLALYHVVPAVPVFTLALALPRVFSRSVWPKRQKAALIFQQAKQIFQQAKQILTNPITPEIVKAKITIAQAAFAKRMTSARAAIGKKLTSKISVRLYFPGLSRIHFPGMSKSRAAQEQRPVPADVAPSEGDLSPASSVFSPKQVSPLIQWRHNDAVQ